MFPTLARLSKASRRALTPKRGNKDYYKGTRQAYLPGGYRTGAPGVHIIHGKAKYRLVDEQVRVFVAPPIDELNASPLKPYVAKAARVHWGDAHAALGHVPGGINGVTYFQHAPRLGPAGEELPSLHAVAVQREKQLADQAAAEAAAEAALPPRERKMREKARRKAGSMIVSAHGVRHVPAPGAAPGAAEAAART